MPEHTPAPTSSRAVYGFAMFLSFRILFVLYLIWALVPEEWFKVIGITCLPQRYWAVTIPILLIIVVLISAFIIYPSLGLFMTPSADEIKTIHDPFCLKNKCELAVPKNDIYDCSCVNKQRCSKDGFDKNSGDFVEQIIPGLQDLNIWDVSEYLYLK